MCGIAGYSLTAREHRSDGRSQPSVLLAGIAERAPTQSDIAYRDARHRLAVHKQRTGASALLEQVEVPDEATQAAHPRPRLHEGPPHDRGEQPPGPARGRRRDPQRDHPQRRRALRAARLRRAREPDMTVDSEAIFALVERDGRRSRRSRSCTARWPPPGSTSARPDVPLPRPRRRPAALGRPRARTRSSSPRPGTRSRSIERYLDAAALEARGARGLARDARRRRRRRLGVVPPGRVRRGVAAAGRSRPEERDSCLAPPPRARRGRLTQSRVCRVVSGCTRERGRRGSRLPDGCAAARGSRVCGSVPEHLGQTLLSSATSRPSGATVAAFLDEPLADEVLERRPGAAAGVEHPVDLPLGEERRRPRGARPSSRRTSAAARAARAARRPARGPARAAPRPPGRRSRPRAARSSASRTCASRATSTASSPRCASRSRRRRRPAQLARRARAAGATSSSRVAKRRGTRPASRFAAFQLPKCSITVCG